MRILLVLVLIFVPTRQDNPCQEGFFGENCKLECSKNCQLLETFRTCDKSTGKCSEGCKSGFHGSTCNLSCKCPGNCIQETGECIDDVTTTTASTQFHEAVPTRQDSLCLEGFFGENCKLKCSRNCRPFETYLCDKSTGKCSEGCKRRLYGPTCNLTCNCSGDCIQATGECIDDVTTTTASTQCHEAVPDCSCVVEYVVVAAIFIIILCLIAAVAFFIFRRRRYPAVLYRKQEEEQPTDLEAEPMNSRSSVEQTQELIPASEDIAKQEIENLKEELRQRDEEIERLKRRAKDLKRMAVQRLDRTYAEQKKLLKDMGLLPDAHYHMLADLDRSKLLQCVNVRFDDGQMNKAYVSIDDKGRLVNYGISDQHNESHTGFVHYVGTCSHIPMEKTGFPQYFEVVADIELKKPLGDRDVLLEIAFSKTEDRDVGQYTPRRENCYSFSIAYNSKNNDLMATIASGNKVKKTSFPGFKNKEGSKTSFNFGILTRDVDEKITLFNLKEDSVITTFESVNFVDELWAMFGLTTSFVVKLSMELVVGIAIDLTDAKKLMIDDNLHYQSVESIQESVSKRSSLLRLQDVYYKQ